MYFIDTQKHKISNSPSQYKPHIGPMYTILGAYTTLLL